jgi:hypothetical protein
MFRYHCQIRQFCGALMEQISASFEECMFRAAALQGKVKETSQSCTLLILTIAEFKCVRCLRNSELHKARKSTEQEIGTWQPPREREHERSSERGDQFDTVVEACGSTYDQLVWRRRRWTLASRWIQSSYPKRGAIRAGGDTACAAARRQLAATVSAPTVSSMQLPCSVDDGIAAECGQMAVT